jgi:tetratricopeptide (TPR) repeat protein
MRMFHIIFAVFLSLTLSHAALSQDGPAQEESEAARAARLAAEEESRKLTEEGKQLMKEKDTEGAIEIFKTAVVLDSNNKTAYRNLGIAYSWMGDNKNAISAFKGLVNAAPDYVDGYRHLVLICNMEGLYKEAIEYGEKAMELNKDDFAVMGYLAYDYITVGEYRRSSKLCRRLIENNPDSGRAHRLLAMCYLGMDMRDEAQKAHKKGYDIIRKQSANSYAPEKNKSSKALFKELEAEMLFLEGNRYIENGDQNSSIKLYNRSIKLNPDDFRPYFNLAKIYERIKEKPTAVEYLKKAVALNPGMLAQIMESEEFDSLKGLEAFKEMLPEEPAEKEVE